MIRPLTPPSASGKHEPADAVAAQAQAQITLPADMAQALKSLNLLQKAYDRGQEDLDSRHAQLFSDWWKYLLCAYPPEDSRDAYPDIDEVKDSIERMGLAAFRTRTDEVGTLGLLREADSEQIALSTWTRQPWHPFLLEWQVEVFPAKRGGNRDSDDGRYSAEFVTSNYSLAENQLEIDGRRGAPEVVQGANIYSGRSILTPHAGIQLRKQIEAYLDRHQSDAMPSIKAAYDVLTGPRFHCLSQVFSGFNQALLMHRQAPLLPPVDPLGFDDDQALAGQGFEFYQAFARAVATAMGKSVRGAPLPLNDFNPIRSGHMKILKLRLIDTFGQVKDLDVKTVDSVAQMTVPEGQELIALRPRLMQPARLSFRWLSAVEGELETNDHPATTPICGWVLPNNLDGSLMVYDKQGAALGYIDRQARWRPTPGQGGAVIEPGEPLPDGVISNPHLRRVASEIRAGGKDFPDGFITTLDSALETIDPETFPQHQGLALVMGRPIAVVRAAVKFELKGPPAIDQS